MWMAVFSLRFLPLVITYCHNKGHCRNSFLFSSFRRDSIIWILRKCWFTFPAFFFFFQMDDVISQAQATRAVLGSQRALFTDVQGKVKGLGDKFPMIQSLLGILQFLSSNFPLIFRFASDQVCAFTGSIRRRRSRDTLILSAVIAACTLFLIIYWLSKWPKYSVTQYELWYCLLSIEFFRLSVFFFFYLLQRRGRVGFFFNPLSRSLIFVCQLLTLKKLFDFLYKSVSNSKFHIVSGLMSSIYSSFLNIFLLGNPRVTSSLRQSDQW